MNFDFTRDRNQGSSSRSPSTVQLNIRATYLLSACLQGSLLLFPFAKYLHAGAPQNPVRPATTSSSDSGPGQFANAPTPESQNANQPIPLPQIANRAEQLDSSLLETSRRLSSNDEMLSAAERIQAHDNEIRGRLFLLDRMIRASTAFELRDEEFYWASLNREYEEWREFLTSRATDLEDRLHFVDAEKGDWQDTWDQIHNAEGLEAVADRVGQELSRINAVRNQIQDQLNLALTLQNKVLQQHRQIAGARSRISEAQKQLRGHVLARDGYPLGDIRALRGLGPPMGGPVFATVGRELRGVEDYARANVPFVSTTICLYGLALLLAFRIRRYVTSVGGLGLPPEGLKILSRPFSLALLVALLGTIGQFHRVTTGVAVIIAWLWLILALRLVPLLFGPGMIAFVRSMVAIWVLESASALLPFSTFLKQLLFLFTILGALAILIWLDRQFLSNGLATPDRISKLVSVAVRVGIALLSASLVSNLLGFLSLSRTLGVSVLVGLFGVVAAYTAARVLSFMLVICLRTCWSRWLPDMNSMTAEHWGTRALFFGAALIWSVGMLQLFGIYDGVTALTFRVMRHPLGYGNVHFTLGGVLSVLLTVLVGYALARIARWMVSQLLLPRLHLHRGAPYAISKVTYYVLLLLVAVTALANAGIELNKFTVLTGALGVGLGFGLQNIVNNFVSGLILLFERPIHVGDTVDVGGLVGTVRRIGARSSTVLTFQGAEVIVPNSNLITNQVVNWTLSSPWRRVDIPVGVAYGTDPARVLKLLVEVANSHPGVLPQRPPTAFFLGFGDSALNFELRFWSASQETWFELRSDVTLAVARALQEAGIVVPFPQRDIHLWTADSSVEEGAGDNQSRFRSLVRSRRVQSSLAGRGQQDSNEEAGSQADARPQKPSPISKD